jgi:hypothetical protein
MKRPSLVLVLAGIISIALSLVLAFRFFNLFQPFFFGGLALLIAGFVRSTSPKNKPGQPDSSTSSALAIGITIALAVFIVPVIIGLLALGSG